MMNSKYKYKIDMIGHKRRHFLDLEEVELPVSTSKKPRDESLEIGDNAEK